MGVRIVSEPVGLTRPRDLPGNLDRFVHLVWSQGNGDFAARPFGVAWLVSLLCAVLASLGLLFVLAVALRTALRGRSSPVLAYTLYWGLVLCFLSASFVFSTGGQRRGWYLIVLVYAAPAVLPIVVSLGGSRRSEHLRTGLAAAAGFLIVVNAVSLARGEFRFGGPGPLAANEPRIARLARSQGISVAYADYWSGSSLSWGSQLKLHVYPVRTCGLDSTSGLCPMLLNVVTSWYTPRPGAKTMLITQAGSAYVPEKPDPRFGPPLRRYTVGPFSVYVFGYDLASRFG
jgi:hypothetical protein